MFTLEKYWWLFSTTKINSLLDLCFVLYDTKTNMEILSICSLQHILLPDLMWKVGCKKFQSSTSMFSGGNFNKVLIISSGFCVRPRVWHKLTDFALIVLNIQSQNLKINWKMEPWTMTCNFPCYYYFLLQAEIEMNCMKYSFKYYSQ